MYGRIALTAAAALSRSSGFFESGSRPRYFSAAGKTSVGLSTTLTPQSLNFATTAGSNSSLSEFERRVGQAPPDLAGVEAQPRRAPHPGHGVGVAGIDLGELRLDPRIDLAPVGELRDVDRPVKAREELALEERRRGGHHHVVQRAPGLELGVEDLVGLVGRVVDLDAGPLLEDRELVERDIFREVVDADRRLAERGARGPSQQTGQQTGDQHGTHATLRRRSAHDTPVAPRMICPV